MLARIRQLLSTTALRLSLRYAGLQTLLLAAALAALLIFANRYVAAQLEAGLAGEASTLATLSRDRLTRRIAALSATPGPRHYLLLDAQGRVLAGNLVAWPRALPPDGRAHRVTALAHDPEEHDQAERVNLIARSSVLAGGLRLVVAQEPGATEDLREAVLIAAGGVLALSAALSLLLGFALGWKWLMRIDAINRTAGAIANGDLTQRVQIQGHGDEFDLLAGHLNHMLTRIEAAVTGMRAVSDHVAHDLRRPLTRVKTRIEVLLEAPRSADDYRAALQQTVMDADELMRTFDALLSIARLEAGGEIVAPQHFDLAAVADEVAELYAAEAEDAGRPFAVEIAGDAPVKGDARLVAQALANLLDNTFKYTVPHTPVTVRLTREGTHARLAVVDRGAGLADADKTRLVARFARGDAARSQPGSGLGLALASAVAHAHRGRLELRDTPGGGLDAGLVLPLADTG